MEECLHTIRTRLDLNTYSRKTRYNEFTVYVCLYNKNLLTKTPTGRLVISEMPTTTQYSMLADSFIRVITDCT